jgi:hypothetical protein
MFSVQTQRHNIVWVDDVDRLIRVVLLTSCENDYFVHLGYLTQTFWRVWSNIDAHFLVSNHKPVLTGLQAQW